ncbi:BgTH12-03902 [Blumeria graminis f. sp. triticale]|uniref:BgtAcSP-30530 n=2 Tax=Blumeria graminis TaxID=34373 RepID=A0A9X9L999_BLUGR|nr:BgTH12-03902 [Blumeria graminis f. sp. triticale]VCU39957.1 BgtAcSP-30530 [Blumeria graminis f. sp. tritici]
MKFQCLVTLFTFFCLAIQEIVCRFLPNQKADNVPMGGDISDHIHEREMHKAFSCRNKVFVFKHFGPSLKEVCQILMTQHRQTVFSKSLVRLLNDDPVATNEDYLYPVMKDGTTPSLHSDEETPIDYNQPYAMVVSKRCEVKAMVNLPRYWNINSKGTRRLITCQIIPLGTDA